MKLSEAQEAARRYYMDLRFHPDGTWADMLVDEYGSGIPDRHWDAMKQAGWFKYESGSYILGGCEIWRITPAGRAALKETENGD